MRKLRKARPGAGVRQVAATGRYEARKASGLSGTPDNICVHLGTFEQRSQAIAARKGAERMLEYLNKNGFLL